MQELNDKTFARSIGNAKAVNSIGVLPNIVKIFFCLKIYLRI